MGRPAVEALGVHHIALERLEAGQLRDQRIGGNPVREHDVARVHDPLAAVSQLERRVPAPGPVVPLTLRELRAGPVVDLHGLRIDLEPHPQHVLRNVVRPRRRERHVGQVVDLDRVMQCQRVVAVAPTVADPRPLLDDERVNAELVQSRGHGKPGLRTAHHQHRWLWPIVVLRFAPHIFPVVAAEVARVGGTARTVTADRLLKPRQLLKRRGQHPGFVTGLAPVP